MMSWSSEIGLSSQWNGPASMALQPQYAMVQGTGVHQLQVRSCRGGADGMRGGTSLGSGQSWLLHLPLHDVIQQTHIAPASPAASRCRWGPGDRADLGHGRCCGGAEPGPGSLSHPQPSQWHAKHSPKSPCAGYRGNSCRGPSAASGAGTAPRARPGSKFKLVLCVFVHASAGSSPHSPAPPCCTEETEGRRSSSRLGPGEGGLHCRAGGEETARGATPWSPLLPRVT